MIRTILLSGVGSRQADEISESAVAKYLGMGMWAYAGLLQVIHTNKLAYHFDWSTLSPFTPDIPAAAFARAKSHEASDSELGDVWLPLMRRAESLIMFPEVALEIKRLMQPFLTLDMHPTLIIPRLYAIDDHQNVMSTDDSVIMHELIKDQLDFCELTLATIQALLRAFIPFDLASIRPWDCPPYQTDPIVEAGQWNSGLSGPAAFELSATVADVEETGIEDDQSLLVAGHGGFSQAAEVGGLSMSFDSRYPQPVWGEVKRSTIYRYSRPAVNVFKRELLSPHHIHNMFFVDDAGDLDTVTESDTEVIRFWRYVNSKFYGSAVNYGVTKPGYLTSNVHLDAVERLLYQEVINNFDVPRLRNVLGATTGASNRVVRELISKIATDKYA